jgi:hypothetical protein
MVVTCQTVICFPFGIFSVAIYWWSCVLVNKAVGNVNLAGQIVIVENSAIGSEVMYGFNLAGNHMWKGHKWEGNI